MWFLFQPLRRRKSFKTLLHISAGGCLDSIFEAKQKLLKELGWSENPFVKDLRTQDKTVFMKYYCPFEAASILQKLAFDTKACLLLGPKGVGKTSALQFVSYNLPLQEFLPIFFKEPPESLSEVRDSIPIQGFLERILFILGRRSLSRQAVAERLKKERRKIVFFLDEAHLEKNPGMYMEFKYLLDEVPNLRLVMSALGKENFPDSLLQLIGEPNVFQRKGFSEDEMLQIISRRVAAVGGRGLEPFSEDFLKSVFTEQNLLSPRYVFDELNNYLAQLALGKAEGFEAVGEGEAAEQRVRAIEASDGTSFTTSHADWWVLLSPSQQLVMNLLMKTDGLTLSAIMERTGLSQNTAFNALYQLRGDDAAEVKRKPEVPFPLVVVKQRMVGGRKKNIYLVDQKIKHLFTLH